MTRRLEQRLVFVTGGGSGLGAATCRLLAAEGATVAVADIELRAAKAVADEIVGSGMAAFPLQVDVGDEAAGPAALEEAAERHGGLYALVNNAGTDQTLAIGELSVAQWDRVIRTNLRGPFLLSRSAAGLMKRGGGGHIVNVASTASKRAWPNASAYHASKWGLLGLSHALHAELRPHGIKVCALIAGGMQTPFLLDRFPDIDRTTLQDPNDVAQTIKHVLLQPEGTVISEVMVLPMRETSWP
jgi:NAD(P)-dependent dehydrogenase (short-subunit alcohol dehydrogenase family)